MRLKAQILHLRKKKLIMDRNEIKENLCKLLDSDDFLRDIDQSQKRFYKVQLEIFALILEVIREKENLLQHQRRSLDNSNKTQDGKRGFAPPVLDSLPELGSIKLEDNDNEDQFRGCAANHYGRNENESESDEEEDEFFDSQTNFSNEVEGGETNNKWENSRKLFVEETKESSKKKELINSINKLYRKRAVVRNRQVCFLYTYILNYQVVFLQIMQIDYNSIAIVLLLFPFGFQL